MPKALYGGFRCSPVLFLSFLGCTGVGFSVFPFFTFPFSLFSSLQVISLSSSFAGPPTFSYILVFHFVFSIPGMGLSYMICIQDPPPLIIHFVLLFWTFILDILLYVMSFPPFVIPGRGPFASFLSPCFGRSFPSHFSKGLDIQGGLLLARRLLSPCILVFYFGLSSLTGGFLFHLSWPPPLFLRHSGMYFVIPGGAFVPACPLSCLGLLCFVISEIEEKNYIFGVLYSRPLSL